MINNLGTRLFKSVTDKAGDLGDKFEEEFSRLSNNITAEVEAVVAEVISLSGFIKVSLVILCVLLSRELYMTHQYPLKVLAIIRLSAFGFRCLMFKAKDWMKSDENKPPPQVILLMPVGDGKYRPTKTVYADPQTKSIIDRIQRDSFELFNEYDEPEAIVPRTKAPKLNEMRAIK
ncbi:hypothetical protein KIN20_036330 [Parelaphostrongylus tenuis]|uniref:Uncharacterized protein n=1 Tax=Parelaphostrongylus tenuis TaxID=148309 RepID=A0AAD5RCS8_PARTN|nr:hypothetical protein KIN20_036330 [Parelaphostrongylus tenuis]